MDGIANIAKQQTQMATNEMQGRVHSTQQVQKEMMEDSKVKETSLVQNEKLNSKEQLKRLIDDLNSALSPLNTNIKFGVDKNDIFYVSVIEAKTNKMIRRFPAEEAKALLPKMQELTGILFDSKG